MAFARIVWLATLVGTIQLSIADVVQFPSLSTSACFVSKGCFANPPNCYNAANKTDTSRCVSMVTYSQSADNPDYATIELFLKDDGSADSHYAAIGFNNKPQMTGAAVTACLFAGTKPVAPIDTGDITLSPGIFIPNVQSILLSPDNNTVQSNMQQFVTQLVTNVYAYGKNKISEVVVNSLQQAFLGNGAQKAAPLVTTFGNTANVLGLFDNVLDGSNQRTSVPVLTDSGLNVQYELLPLVATRANGYYACTFRQHLRPNCQTGSNQYALCGGMHDLSKPLYVLLANGLVNTANLTLQKHRSALSTDKMVDLLDFNVQAPADVLPLAVREALIRTHGMSMLIGWWFFASVAIFFARYMKEVWPETELGGSKVWFVFHRLFNVFAVLCISLGFACIFGSAKGLWLPLTDPSVVLRNHAICGMTATVCVFLQLMMGVCRCKLESPYRVVFNKLHRFLGISAWCLAGAAIFLATYINADGNGLYRATNPFTSRAVMIAYLASTLAALTLFEFFDFYVAIKTRRVEQGKEIRHIGMSTFINRPSLKMNNKSRVAPPTDPNGMFTFEMHEAESPPVFGAPHAGANGVPRTSTNASAISPRGVDSPTHKYQLPIARLVVLLLFAVAAIGFVVALSVLLASAD